MRPSRRSNPLVILASVAASLALFACSGDREAQGVVPAGEEPAQKAAESAPPPVDAAATSAPPPADAADTTASPTGSTAPSGEPEASSWAIEAPLPEQTARNTFGSDEIPEEETAPRQRAKPEPLPTGGHVFTNKDLGRYRSMGAFGRKDEADAASRRHPDKSGGDDEDPNKPKDDKALTPEEAQAQIDATQAEINKAEENLKYLRSRPASIHNPFLPRVQPNEEDAAKESGMDNVQRLEHVNARIAETEASINELRRKLETLRQSKTSPPNQ